MLLIPFSCPASEYDQYKLENGDSFSGWVVAAGGERVLFKNKEGVYSFIPFCDLEEAAKSKIEDLREAKDIVSLSQHVETSNADPDRLLIPTYNQGSYDQYWGCVANASINFLLWWDKIGVCHIPDEGTEADKAEWLHDKLYTYVKTFDREGSTIDKLSRGLKMFFEENPSDHYTFEYEIIRLGDHPEALAENATGLNMTVLSLSSIASGQRQYGHAVSLIQASENRGVVLNTWGKTYFAQLYEPCGLFRSSGFLSDHTLWDLDCSTTSPDDFEKQGYHWTVSKYDALLVVRPIRRPDAPPKLVDKPSSKASEAQTQRIGGAAVFGKDQALDYKGYSYRFFYGTSGLDRWSVRLNQQEIKDYICVHSPSRVRYRIPDGVSSFTAIGTGLWNDDVCFSAGKSWRYIVEVDGKEVFESKDIRDYPDGLVPVFVEIPEGADWIELIAIDMIHRRSPFFAVWAQPEFK